jgi:hypothetical protein
MKSKCHRRWFHEKLDKGKRFELNPQYFLQEVFFVSSIKFLSKPTFAFIFFVSYAFLCFFVQTPKIPLSLFVFSLLSQHKIFSLSGQGYTNKKIG